MRTMFRLLNRFFMIPLFRLGLGKFMVNPFTGYIMVLKTIGHKSGTVRFAPVNYAIHKGHVYCVAGLGERTHWYRNLRANPELELIMPGGAWWGSAEEVPQGEEKVEIFRQVMVNAGFAGFFYGFNPRRASQEQLAQVADKLPIVRIAVKGVGNGPADAGGWLWISTILIVILLVLGWIFLN